MLAPGSRLGPYEIVAPLGAGGMGEVYRARDSRLGRDVAIKALPAEFARDPERLARFEREARLLASLNHPNVAGIHGLEEVEGHRYLVLELVEGESLAERIERGALPVDEALEVCRQVAAGVEAAHEAGVVHRDLKPDNVMLRSDGTVKVLDFGLAKSGTGSPTSSDPNLSASPTLTSAATTAGVILGTAAYMSPEQARGRAVDKRSDVWSFGCVLYECLTARQAFHGETISDTIAAILKTSPDLDALPANVPARVRDLIARCLCKDVRDRLRDIGEARVVLGSPGAAAVGAIASDRPGRRAAPPWLVPALTAGLAIAATAALLPAFRPGASHGPVRRFRVPVPWLKQTFFTSMALTRDGRFLAFEANNRMWIRRLDRAEAVEVPGSTKSRSPFWSWDQSTLCFSRDRKLWAFTPGSDQPREICSIPESGEIVGGAWSADARIVMAVWRGGLYEVPAGGGEVRLSVPLDSSTVDFHGPSILPDGRTVLLYVHDRQERSAVAIVEGTPSRLRRIYDASNWSSVSYSPAGYLLASAEGAGSRGEVWAIPFSARSRKVTGPAFRIVDGAAFASTSDDGLMVAYVQAPPSLGRLVWRRRDGSETAIGEPQRGLSTPVLAPDGGRVAYVAEQDGNTDIWVQDLVRGTRTRLTADPVSEQHPAWSPDGARVFYVAGVGVGRVDIVAVACDGSGSPDTVAHGFQPTLSPDGRNLVYTVDRKGNGDLWTLALDPRAAARPLLASPADENSPSFSPDGRWLAYASDESGRNEIYLRRFPEGGARLQVSVNGGSWPRWTRRGDGIYYVTRDTIMLVPVSAGARPNLGLPRPLFTTDSSEFRLSASMVGGAPVDEHPDGVRFIAVQPAGPPEPPSLLFVENWLEEFRKR